MISYDRASRTELAVCICGWRSLAGTHAQAERAAMDHIYRSHAVTELERDRAIHAHHERLSARRHADPDDIVT